MGLEVVIWLILGVAVGAMMVIIIGGRRKKQSDINFQQEIDDLKTNRMGIEKDLLYFIEKTERLQQVIVQLENQIEQERERRHEAEKSLVAKEGEIGHLNQKMEAEQSQMEILQRRLHVEFENVAHKILKEQTSDFQLSSQKGLQDVLQPLREKLHSFERKVEETYEKGLKNQSDLRAELKKIYELSVTLDKDAKNLTRALKSDNKQQGNWGEIILERVLERSGLTKDQEYYLQYSAKNDEGATLRPDVVIKLPEDKHLIIDSKVSLVAFTDYVSTDDEQLRARKLRDHLESMRRHVKELSNKRYDQLLGINSPDFVLMFMPVEPAFAVAVQSDMDLFNDAWSDRVVIVSPTTLLATLRTVASIWKYEKQNQHALEIADRGGKLYDKFESFVKDLESIGQSIEKADKSYKDAHKKLTSGSGNLIRQVEQLKIMGVTTKKSLPANLINDIND
jgi:DNA recombination protein RmuC